MKFELNRLTNYSDEELIKEIQRVAKLLNVTPLTGVAFNNESKASKSTVIGRFGGWKEALEAANLGHLYSGRAITKNMREQRNHSLVNEDLFVELRRIAKLVNRKDISTGDIAKHSTFSRDIFANRFGTIDNALVSAGLKSRVLGAARRIHTQESLFSNLYDVWTHYGRQPHYSEMNGINSKIKSRNYTNRFGTWRKALIAFIDYIEKSSVEPENETLNPPPIQKAESLQKNPENRRETSLGLRFKVMYRDNFKCVLCGNNPPASPGLILHIDHILPWSKGGKTEIDNLRTLCASCNLGRGNRFAD